MRNTPMNEIKEAADRIKQEIAKVIVGQDEAVEELLIALFVAATYCSKAFRHR